MNASNAFVWLIVAIVLIVIESLTVQLVSIWFVIGTVPAIIASLLGAEVWLQLVLFLVTSVLALFLIRPWARKRLTPTIEATNVGRVVGMTGLVTEEIDNLKQTGRVHIDGLDWTARSSVEGVVISTDSKIEALKIDGVKLIVKPIV